MKEELSVTELEDIKAQEIDKSIDVLPDDDNISYNKRQEQEFEKELEDLINRYSQENGSDTPDFILAKYLCACLEAFNVTTKRRTKWYGPKHDCDAAS